MIFLNICTDYEDKYSCRTLPYGIIMLSLMQIAVFAIRDYSNVAEILMFKPKERLEVWRYATYMLVHER